MNSRGHTLLETLVVVTAIGIVAGAAVPSFLFARDEARAFGAARYLAAELHRTRLEALKRHVHVAVRFEPGPDDYRLAWYADGNGNGVRSLEIDEATDPRLGPAESLAGRFPGVRFALGEGVIDLEGADATGTDPVRVGRSRMISFSPSGTSTSGTVYVLGRRVHQFAVRVLGPTGRIRTFEFTFGDRSWHQR